MNKITNPVEFADLGSLIKSAKQAKAPFRFLSDRTDKCLDIKYGDFILVLPSELQVPKSKFKTKAMQAKLKSLTIKENRYNHNKFWLNLPETSNDDLDMF